MPLQVVKDKLKWFIHIWVGEGGFDICGGVLKKLYSSYLLTMNGVML